MDNDPTFLNNTSNSLRAELSIQGDDFTRQIWHMYATFEEFIDNHTSFGAGRNNRTSKTEEPAKHDELETDDAGASGAGHRHRLIGGSALELTSMAASTSGTQTFDAGSKDDMSLFYRRPHHMCHYRRRRKRMDISNPLLETISAIQDVCETDYHDIAESGDHYYGTNRDHKYHGSKLCSDGDKDSIGYAGSNSIDSGYKSSCPTPEPSDCMLYCNEGSAKRGSVASQNSQKPRIAMGTKVMNRHSHPQYQGRDLEHLIYLRQSILSAMQRYEQETVVSFPSPGFRPRSSSASSPGYRSASPSPCHSSSPLPQRRPLMASCPSSRTHSPCYSSASNGSGKSSPGFHRSRLVTAEEDIDALLYGRVDELPCSYVTMIEDKYRRSSVARVKKLKEKGIGGDSSSSESSCTSPPIQSPQVSGRFSEVAKCMLEIIEDLQNKGDIPPPAPSGPTPAPSTTESEYHVYEEIMYDMACIPRTESAPPPLPARPQGGFTRSIPQPHRPKQRSNLYSLFREPNTRKDISHSLELESRRAVPRPPTDAQIEQKEDEYGFTMPRK